jgi:hypothetical protein
VEEVDILSLDTKDIVRFKVHVKSVAMIPPIIEVGVKPFLYDIYFKIDNITDEGWNDDSINLGKRASVDRQGLLILFLRNLEKWQKMLVKKLAWMI